jgi:hypothetical protein
MPPRKGLTEIQLILGDVPNVLSVLAINLTHLGHYPFDEATSVFDDPLFITHIPLFWKAKK